MFLSIWEAIFFNYLAFPYRKTFLGTYEGKNVVVMKNFLEPEDDLVAFNGVGESSLERDKELYQYTYEDITAMLRGEYESQQMSRRQSTVSGICSSWML